MSPSKNSTKPNNTVTHREDHQPKENTMTTKNTHAKKSSKTVNHHETTQPKEKPMTTKSTHAEKSNTSTPEVSATASSVSSTAAAAVSAPSSITSAEVEQCQQLLNQIDGILGPVTQLSVGDTRRSLKLRKGGAQVVTQLLALCNHHGVTAVGPVTTESMSEQKARADTLNQIGVQFKAVGKKLADATFSAESGTWQQATALYTVLQRLSLMNPTLALGIKPVQDFFQTKRTKGKERANKDAQKAKVAEKLIAKVSPPETSAQTSGAENAGASAGASNGGNASAQVAATLAPTNGATHS